MPFLLSNCSVDFPEKYQNWTLTDPLDLFQAPVLKTEANPKVQLFLPCVLLWIRKTFSSDSYVICWDDLGVKAHIRRHLSQEARGYGNLVLWLDCDREGENICFEGISLIPSPYQSPLAASLSNTC